jgi:Peptidase family M20/M25/M40
VPHEDSTTQLSRELSDTRLLAFLREIVAIDFTPGREERIVHRIADEMKSLGYQDARVDEAGNAVGHFGEGSPVILTDCHVDTIPDHGKGLWHHEPFAAEMDGDRLYGLGVSDMTMPWLCVKRWRSFRCCGAHCSRLGHETASTGTTSIWRLVRSSPVQSRQARYWTYFRPPVLPSRISQSRRTSS